jgi:3-oxoadipate enol-lactonase
MTDFTYQGADGCPLLATQLGDGPPLVLLHGGGPDHHSLLPLAERLADRYTVILPDVRGYGRSVCTDPARHTWSQYTIDVISLLDHLRLPAAALGGTGLGSTVTLRTAREHPDRIRAAIAISVENIEENEQDKAAEVAFLDAFAERVRTDGIEAAWALILPALAPVIGALVRDAIPRSDPASIAAAAAIGRDLAFSAVDDLATIRVPTLVIPGTDARHPTELAERVVRVMPDARLAAVGFSADLRTAEDLGATLAPAVREFLDARS